jgi:CheY-like chemotaxis protein
MDPIDLTYSLKNSFSAVRDLTFLRYNRDRTEGKAMPAHILVVEDDAEQRSDLAEIVKSLGYQVTTAADGREALSKLAILPTSAILTDLVMPRMDGVALLKELAVRGDRTPALVLTGFGSLD